jgi:hypothetical protein
MWEDMLVAEVRRAREAYAAKYGYDLRTLYQVLKAQEEREEREKVTFPPKRIAIETQAAFSLVASPVV